MLFVLRSVGLNLWVNSLLCFFLILLTTIAIVVVTIVVLTILVVAIIVVSVVAIVAATSVAVVSVVVFAAFVFVVEASQVVEFDNVVVTDFFCNGLHKFGAAKFFRDLILLVHFLNFTDVIGVDSDDILWAVFFW